MDMRQLKYFAEVAKEKSFTKAADNLYMSQPALSKMIKKLEDELGIQLFDRHSNTVELTDSGEALLNSTKTLLWHFTNIYNSIQDTKDLKKGHITVGIPPIIGVLYFAPIIVNFKSKYPGIDLIIVEDGARTITSKVLSGDLEIGIVIQPVTDEKLLEIPMFMDEVAAIINKSNPLASSDNVSFGDLQHETFNLLNTGFLLHEQILERCKEAGFSPNIGFISSQWDFIAKMVSLNNGVSILPRPIIYNRFPDLRILPFRPKFPWVITLIVRKDKYISNAMNAFITCVEQFFSNIIKD